MDEILTSIETVLGGHYFGHVHVKLSQVYNMKSLKQNCKEEKSIRLILWVSWNISFGFLGGKIKKRWLWWCSRWNNFPTMHTVFAAHSNPLRHRPLFAPHPNINTFIPMGNWVDEKSVKKVGRFQVGFQRDLFLNLWYKRGDIIFIWEKLQKYWWGGQLILWKNFPELLFCKVYFIVYQFL